MQVFFSYTVIGIDYYQKHLKKRNWRNFSLISMPTVCQVRQALAQIKPELLSGYDRYLKSSAGKRRPLLLEEYRAAFFPSHPPLNSVLLEKYEREYLLYRTKYSTTITSFESYTSTRLNQLSQEQEQEEKEKESEPIIEEVHEEEEEEEEEEEREEEEELRALPSSTLVHTDLLKRWRKTGIDGMTNKEITKLEESIKSICRANGLKGMSNAQPFNEFQASACPSHRHVPSSSCDWHERLRRTHKLENTENPHVAEGAGPTYLVYHRAALASGASLKLSDTPHGGGEEEIEDSGIREELVHPGELDEDSMLVDSTFLDSSGLISWLRNKVVRYTGRGLPSGLKEHFEDEDNFKEAVELAERVFMANGKELRTAAAEKNLKQLSQRDLDLLFALTQYMCHVTKSTNIRRPSSGTCNIQHWHKMACHHGCHELEEPMDIVKKIVQCGFASLTPCEKTRLCAALGQNDKKKKTLPSSYQVVRTKYSTSPDSDLRTLEQWKLEVIRQKIIEDLQLYERQIRKGIVLPPPLTLEQALQPETLQRSLFLQDLNQTYQDQLDDITRGVGVWLVPTNIKYQEDSHRPDSPTASDEDKRDYFQHFFVDLNPESDLGKLNRNNVAKAEKRKKNSILLVTNASKRVRSKSLFPDPLLRKDFHTTLFALLANTSPNPRTDYTMVTQLEQLPEALF